jgi:hypothetical protein
MIEIFFSQSHDRILFTVGFGRSWAFSKPIEQLKVVAIERDFTQRGICRSVKD